MDNKTIIDRSVLMAIIALSVYLSVEALQFPNKGGMFPIFSLSCIALLSLFTLVSEWRRGRKERGCSGGEPENRREAGALKRPMTLFALTLAQSALMPVVGFYCTTGAFIIIAGYCIGLRRVRMVSVIAAVTMAVFYGFFEFALKFEFPRGLLF